MLLSSVQRLAAVAASNPASAGCAWALYTHCSPALRTMAGMPAVAAAATGQASVEVAARAVALAAEEAAEAAEKYMQALNSSASSKPMDSSVAMAAALAAEKSAEASAAASEAAYLWHTLRQHASNFEREYHLAEYVNGQPSLHHQPAVGPAIPEREFVDLVDPVDPRLVHAVGTCAAAIKPKTEAELNASYMAGS